MFDGLAELAIEARNLDSMERFYSMALGLSVLARESDRVWLDLGGGARLGLWLPGEKEYGDRGGRHVHFALAANGDTFAAVHDRLRIYGADLWGPIEHPGGDCSLYVRDPEGNVVEIWEDCPLRGVPLGRMLGAAR
jgi:catechol-2,3-dioxygenase